MLKYFYCYKNHLFRFSLAPVWEHSFFPRREKLLAYSPTCVSCLYSSVSCWRDIASTNHSPLQSKPRWKLVKLELQLGLQVINSLGSLLLVRIFKLWCKQHWIHDIKSSKLLNISQQSAVLLGWWNPTPLELVWTGMVLWLSHVAQSSVSINHPKTLGGYSMSTSSHSPTFPGD